MKTIYKIAFASILIFCGACADMDKINTNPDGISSVTPQMLATKLILNITNDDIGSEKGFMLPFMRDKYILWSEYPEDAQYNRLNRASFSDMTRLTDAQKMMELSQDLKEGEKNAYTGLAYFIRAYYFFNLTIQVGDMPYSEAIKGETEGDTKPTYDTQKDIFIGILKELDLADNLFANASQFDGDIIYGGDVNKWRKMVNSFQLKVLINLHKKTGDSDLNVAQKFKDIVSNRPIFSNNEDNFSLVYSNQQNQMYPFFKQGNQFVIYPMVSSVLIDKLKILNDYRLFYYTEPSPVKIEEGLSDSDFDAYVGVEPSLEYSAVSSISSSKDYSDINLRYKETPEGEPVYLLSYAQVEFMLAEAAVRGWVGETPEEHYNQGVKAAMEYVRDNTPINTYNHGMDITDNYIEAYIESAEVKLSSDPNTQMEQIITQKYLSTFLQSPLSAFFENRRTGYPYFEINPASNQNEPSNKLPVRWMYPSDEVQYNLEHVNEATNRQYNGGDDNNGIMWILQ
ncbi:SusD/RagB family nutrient-binding outer membrane lipoprotein [Galbibacter sp. PAP.153]|uniref:SusD/RagB family nutrient-binding outer membrane lipoprotein n=1 Tax=Galbibacter sp. PAP.153 TaxID=3104623 RepID=UPI003007F82D